MSSAHTDQTKQTHRTSFYLVSRAEALLGAINFFSSRSSDRRRRLQFLVQSDFWEWELDNLIYSFVTLSDRQKTWRSDFASKEKLGNMGIALQAKMFRKVKWTDGVWKTQQEGVRVAPLEMLKNVIDAWNDLIGFVEQEFIVPMQSDAKKWNISTRADLKSMYRTMPQGLDVLDETSDESGE